ncbi:MAG: hypothetical protein K6L60_05575 [Oceanobacter sp.]
MMLGLSGVAANATKQHATKLESTNPEIEAISKPDHINPSDYSSADGLNAAVLRTDWENFSENDVPYIMQFAEDITSGRTVTNAVDQAADNIDRGFGLAEASMQRRDEGFGLALTDAQKANRESDLKRSAALAKVDAMNNARTAGKDREMAQLSGSYTGG